MVNIARFDPFNEMDDFFRGLLVRPLRFDLDNGTQMRLKMDVTRTDDTYTVKTEIPGAAKDDIHVTIDGNQVTISGEVCKKKEEKRRKGLFAVNVITAPFPAVSRCRRKSMKTRLWPSPPTAC